VTQVRVQGVVEEERALERIRVVAGDLREAVADRPQPPTRSESVEPGAP
jgi:hypothetical protein